MISNELKDVVKGEEVYCDGHSSFCEGSIEKVVNVESQYCKETGKEYNVVYLSGGRKFDSRNGMAMNFPSAYYITVIGDGKEGGLDSFNDSDLLAEKSTRKDTVNERVALNDEFEVTLKVKVKLKSISNDYGLLSDNDRKGEVKYFKKAISYHLKAKLEGKYSKETVTLSTDDWDYEVD